MIVIDSICVLKLKMHFDIFYVMLMAMVNCVWNWNCQFYQSICCRDFIFFPCSVQYLSGEKQPDFWDTARSSGKQVVLMTINRFLCIFFWFTWTEHKKIAKNESAKSLNGWRDVTSSHKNLLLPGSQSSSVAEIMSSRCSQLILQV